MSAEELKALFSQPLMLLLLMLAASLGSAAKQLIVARRQNEGLTLKEYFLKVETLIMLGHNVAAWLTLLFSDTLNVASALGAGYVANDAADAWTKNGRSGELNDPKPPKDES